MLSCKSIENYSEEVGEHFGGVRLGDRAGGLVDDGWVYELSFGKYKDVFGFSGISVLDGLGAESGVGESSKDLTHLLCFINQILFYINFCIFALLSPLRKIKRNIIKPLKNKISQ